MKAPLSRRLYVDSSIPEVRGIYTRYSRNWVSHPEGEMPSSATPSRWEVSFNS